MCSYVMQIRVPDSPGLLDFAIGLVDSNHQLPYGQVKFFWELKLQITVGQADLTKGNLFNKVSHYISCPT